MCKFSKWNKLSVSKCRTCDSSSVSFFDAQTLEGIKKNIHSRQDIFFIFLKSEALIRFHFKGHLDNGHR